jgi:hypothetical protein
MADFPGANCIGQIMRTINIQAEKVPTDCLAVAQQKGERPQRAGVERLIKMA